MSATSEAVTMLLTQRLGLRQATIRRIVDRLPATLMREMVVEAFIKNQGGVGEDCQGVLPCPFCGGRGDFGHECNSIMCDECGAIGGEHVKESYAVALWNRRVPVRVVMNSKEV